MFEPEVFGWKASELLTLSGTLATATVGFLFLYLSKQPLSELPFGVKTESPVPRALLPVFAIVTLGLTMFLLGCYALLHLFAAKPDMTIIRERFEITRRIHRCLGEFKNWNFRSTPTTGTAICAFLSTGIAFLARRPTAELSINVGKLPIKPLEIFKSSLRISG